MQSTPSALAAVLAFTVAAAATSLEARQGDLKDWQVTGASGHSPSGRPGSYPWSYIIANITDPNAINLGTSEADNSTVTVPAGSQGINCVAKYLTYEGNSESPVGRTWPCDEVEDGFWTMQVLAGTADASFTSRNYDLKFTHVVDKLYLGSRYSTTFEGQGHFEVGKQLGLSCGGSGQCNSGIKTEQNPVLVKAKKL